MFIRSVGNTERSSIVSDYRTIQVCIATLERVCGGVCVSLVRVV